MQRRLDRPVPDIRSTSDDLSIVQTSSPLRQVVVLGAGGHGRELADIVRHVAAQRGQVALLGDADDGDPDRALLARSGFRFLGGRNDLNGRDVDVHLGVGYPNVRARIDHSLMRPATPLVHPTASVGSASTFSDGVVLAQAAIVTTNVSLGRHTHLNVAASVSHDCQLGNYVTVCPQVTVTGSVRVGNRVFIGAGATILPGVTVGDGAIIGAGAVVASNVAPGTTVAGVPARPISS